MYSQIDNMLHDDILLWYIEGRRFDQHELRRGNATNKVHRATIEI